MESFANILYYLSVLVALTVVSCTNTGEQNMSQKTTGIRDAGNADCSYYNDEKSDSVFVCGGDSFKIEVYTTCTGNYVISDTVVYSDTVITHFQDRIVNVVITKGNLLKSYTITKESVKSEYGDCSSFRNSVFSRPHIFSIDTAKNSFEISVFFSYPQCTEGGFGENLYYTVTFNGEVKFLRLEESE